jgi:hypothetical protein
MPKSSCQQRHLTRETSAPSNGLKQSSALCSQGSRTVGPIPRDHGTYQVTYLILTVILAGTPGHPLHRREPHFLHQPPSSSIHPRSRGSSCKLWLRVRCEPHFLSLLVEDMQNVQLSLAGTETETARGHTQSPTTAGVEITPSRCTSDMAQRNVAFRRVDAIIVLSTFETLA